MCLYHNFSCPFTSTTKTETQNFSNPFDQLIRQLSRRDSLFLVRQRCIAKIVDYSFSDTSVVCDYTTVKHSALFDDGDEKPGTEHDCDKCNNTISDRDWAGLTILAIKQKERIPQMLSTKLNSEDSQSDSLILTLAEANSATQIYNLVEEKAKAMQGLIAAIDQVNEMDNDVLAYAIKDGSFITALEDYIPSMLQPEGLDKRDMSDSSQSTPSLTSTSATTATSSRKRNSESAFSSFTQSEENDKETILRLRRTLCERMDQVVDLSEANARLTSREARHMKEMSGLLQKLQFLESENARLLSESEIYQDSKRAKHSHDSTISAESTHHRDSGTQDLALPSITIGNETEDKGTRLKADPDEMDHERDSKPDIQEHTI